MSKLKSKYIHLLIHGRNQQKQKQNKPRNWQKTTKQHTGHVDNVDLLVL